MAKNTAKAKTSTGGEIKGQPAKVIFFLGVLVLVVGGWLWCRNVASSPRNVFMTMLDNSLRTRDVSKQVTQSSGGQKLDQQLQLKTGDTALAHAITQITQGQNGNTLVKTESIGTPNEDYVRYLDIKTDQVGKDGQALDFGNVLNVWGKTQASQVPEKARGELFGEAVLGVVPIGYVQHGPRQELLNFIRSQNVYEVDYAGVKREIKDGRSLYTYPVQVEPEKYVTMLKQFGKIVGLRQLEGFDPSSFHSSPPLQFEMIIDVWSKQLVGVNFNGSPRMERYGSYGSKASAFIPSQTIPVEELQQRLQNIQ